MKNNQIFLQMFITFIRIYKVFNVLFVYFFFFSEAVVNVDS